MDAFEVPSDDNADSEVHVDVVARLVLEGFEEPGDGGT